MFSLKLTEIDIMNDDHIKKIKSIDMNIENCELEDRKKIFDIIMIYFHLNKKSYTMKAKKTKHNKNRREVSPLRND